ncbi:radical SAM/SPASM domain-containing protein [Candidatus Undinarchaeota archaeon]
MRFGPKLGLYCLGYQSYRSVGFPKLLPVSLTLALTSRCNSKCQTCNVWQFYQKDNSMANDELKTDEYEKIIDNLGKSTVWFTMSGGEPFLRKDIVDICKLATRTDPQVINIPSNGLLPKVTEEKVSKILDECKDTKIVINLSLDGIGKRHDEIRGVKGNFKKLLDTYNRLNQLKPNHENFTLGVHTVISKLNVTEIEEIYDYVTKELKPDSYITETAENRVELDTMSKDITPTAADYDKAISYIQKGMADEMKKTKGFHKMIKALRNEYYDIVKKVLAEKRQIIPCYAGIASGQIDPYGNVWPCCIEAKNMGSLRDNNYDLRKVWFSKEADERRKYIKAKNCYCPLANAHYTNMLCNPKIIRLVLGKALI